MARAFNKLTRTAMRSLRPGGSLTEHGINFERVANGDGVFSVNVMVDGSRIHRVIGRESEGVTRSQAEQFIEKARSEARAGRLSLPAGRKTHLSFAEAAKKYEGRLTETNGKNMSVKRRHFKRYLTPFFGSQRLDSISAFTIDRYKRRRLDAGASNGTINLELATLSHLMNCAIEWGWIKTRPCKIKLLEREQGRIIALTDEQAHALFQGALADDDPSCWLFVAFGLNTAMRHREILRTGFEQVDLDKLRLQIPKAKGGRREQPITAELADMLRREMAMRGTEGWIFPSPRPGASFSGHRDRMEKPFRNAVVRAGLDPKIVTPHVLRHTAITKLVQAGIDLPTIQQISGHKTLAMVLRYTHVHGTHIDKAIAALGRTVPEQTVIKDAGTTTQGLHKRLATVASPKFK
jgi:integrase